MEERDGHLGLSPLTRGNPRVSAEMYPRSGPIPAHAGQPPLSCWLMVSLAAYPRSRGATVVDENAAVTVTGLSPLTRGNRKRKSLCPLRSRPIPAHAEQPLVVSWPCRRTRAYPRSRGATIGNAANMLPVPGLSPLTRGNL